MKKFYQLLFLISVLASPAFATREGDQGLGLMLGNPSGLSYKMWFNENVAIDGAAGVNQGEFDIHASLLWHVFDWTKNMQGFESITKNGDLPFYVGIGPRMIFEHNEEFGIRFPVGLSYLPHQTPWEFFGELAPVLRLTPDAGMDVDFAVGMRFYFPAVRARSQ